MSKIVRMVIGLVGLSTILLLAGFASNDLSVDDLPPRPTTEPTAVPSVKVEPIPNGERILLHIENDVDEIPSALWTAVEWQDPNTGDWHVVEGWRGTLDTSTTQTWWVGSELFGDGPFRWQLYANKGGKLLTTSAPFNLPAHTGLMVIVDVTLE